MKIDRHMAKWAEYTVKDGPAGIIKREKVRKLLGGKRVAGATRRDRTGDLLITKPCVSSLFCNYFLVFGLFCAFFEMVETPETCGKTHETEPPC